MSEPLRPTDGEADDLALRALRRLEGWITLPGPGADEPQGFLSADVLAEVRPLLRRIADDLLAARVKRKVDGSDVVQEALVAACAHILQFQGTTREEFYGWLRTITRNKAFRWNEYWDREKRTADREEALPEDSANQQALHAPDTSPSQKAMRREDLERVFAVLDRLPADDQTVIRLRLLEDLAWPEVARRLNVTEEAAQKRVGRALQKLRRALKGEP